jgi:hypothetical protein
MSMQLLWRKLARSMISVAVVFAAATMLMPTAASSAATGKYCSVDLTKATEKCFPTARDLRAHEASVNVLTALTVWNWNGFNNNGGFRNYVISGSDCGDFGVDASDANLNDSTSVYNNGITLHNTIGSFRTNVAL